MKKTIKYASLLLPGAVYAALILLLSQCLIRGLGGIAGAVSKMVGTDDETATYISQVLGQLKDASIDSNWLVAILIGSVIGALFLLWIKRRSTKRIGGYIVLWTVLLIPLVLVAVWFSEVNGVRVDALLTRLLPMLPALL